MRRSSAGGFKFTTPGTVRVEPVWLRNKGRTSRRSAVQVNLVQKRREWRSLGLVGWCAPRVQGQPWVGDRSSRIRAATRERYNERATRVLPVRLSRPSLSLSLFHPLVSRRPPRLASFASVFLFLPFSPLFFVSSLFHQMRHLRGTSSSPEPGERVGRWFTVSSLFPSPLSVSSRSVEVERAQDLPFAALPGRADLSSWFRQSIYEQADDRCTPCLLACLLACLSTLSFLRWLDGWPARSLALVPPLACSCLPAVVVREK